MLATALKQTALGDLRLILCAAQFMHEVPARLLLSQQTSSEIFSASCEISYLLGSTGVELLSQSLQLLLPDEGVALNSKKAKIVI